MVDDALSFLVKTPGSLSIPSSHYVQEMLVACTYSKMRRRIFLKGKQITKETLTREAVKIQETNTHVWIINPTFREST